MQEAGNYAVTQFKHTHSDLQTCGVTDVHTETSPGSQRSRSLSQHSISTAGSTSLLHNNAYIILKAVCSTNDWQKLHHCPKTLYRTPWQSQHWRPPSCVGNSTSCLVSMPQRIPMMPLGVFANQSEASTQYAGNDCGCDLAEYKQNGILISVVLLLFF